jgi:hypothetical protein
MTGAPPIPSITGGAAAPSSAMGGSSQGGTIGGDIVTGGSKLSKLPTYYMIGAGLLAAVIFYKVMHKKKHQ